MSVFGRCVAQPPCKGCYECPLFEYQTFLCVTVLEGPCIAAGILIKKMILFVIIFSAPMLLFQCHVVLLPFYSIRASAVNLTVVSALRALST